MKDVGSVGYRIGRLAMRRAVGVKRAKLMKGKLDLLAEERRVRADLRRWMSRRDARRVAAAYLRRRFPLIGVYPIEIDRLGIELPLRSGTADWFDVYDSLVRRAHLPPEGMLPMSIVDAGLCTGLTLYDLAARYPGARVVGVEPQPYYAELCRRLSRAWGDRIEIIQAAVRPDDGLDAVLHVADCEEYAASFRSTALDESHTVRDLRVQTISLNTIARNLGFIDYLKLDIEGAEHDVLRRNTEWCRRTHSIKVEVHDEYSVEDCIADLTRLDFECGIEVRYSQCVVGIRKDSTRGRI